MALVITPSLGQAADKNGKSRTQERDKAIKKYSFVLSEPTDSSAILDQAGNSSVIVTVSDEGHQKMRNEVETMSTNEFLNKRL